MTYIWIRSVEAVREHATQILADLAHKHNLTYHPFEQVSTVDVVPSKGALTLTDMWATPPAPVTLTDTSAYRVLSGTIRATYMAHRGVRDDAAIAIAPGIMSGNTGMWSRLAVQRN